MEGKRDVMEEVEEEMVLEHWRNQMLTDALHLFLMMKEQQENLYGPLFEDHI
jgi:hypothetical protein